MKGIIFNVAEEIVCEAHGEEAWDRLLVEGAAAHYGEAVDLRQTACMHRVDLACVFELHFQPLPAAA